MKKHILLLVAVIGLHGVAWAQGDGPDACNQCACVADNMCSTVTPCADSGFLDCRGVSFTPNCGTNYYLRAVVSCAGGSDICEYCYACVQLLDNNTGTTAVCHQSCTEDDCTQECPIGTLDPNHNYTLWVCLRRCGDVECSECSGCTARGYVYTTNWSACNTIPACNP